MTTRNNIENNAARATAARFYIVFSVDKRDRPFVLRALARAAVNFKTVLGYYQGTREDSYIVNADQWAAVWRVCAWSIATQESILHLLPVVRFMDARPVLLEYMGIGGFTTLKRPPAFLGYWWAVSRETALARDAWTRDAGQYYVAAFTRPEHVPAPNADAAHRRARYASNESVRVSNRAAVCGHKMAVDCGALHHTTPAYALHGAPMVPGWHRPRPLTVKGQFNKTGGARTPSGHEF